MPKMKLYNSPMSPNTLRVRAVANELGINLEMIDVDLMTGDYKTDAFLKLNPNAKVPTLVDAEFVLWESRAITGYLASQRPESDLYPNDPQKRAIVDQWSYWQAIHLGPAMQKIAFERAFKAKFGMGEPDETAITKEVADTEQFLSVLNQALAGNEWVAGTLSVADFALASTFTFRQAAGISLEEYPHVSGWIERIEERKSWKDAVAPFAAALGK